MLSPAGSIVGEAALLEPPLDGALADKRLRELSAMGKFGP